jgi:hypothetical protein
VALGTVAATGLLSAAILTGFFFIWAIKLPVKNRRIINSRFFILVDKI